MRSVVANLSVALVAASLMGAVLAMRAPLPRATLAGHVESHLMHEIAFSADSRKLVASVRPKTVCAQGLQYVFDVEAGAIEFLLPKAPFAICLSHDGQSAAALLDLEAGIVEYDLVARCERRRWPWEWPASLLAFVSSGELIAHGGGGAWNVRTQTKPTEAKLKWQGDSAYFHRAAGEVASCFKDHQVTLLDARTAEVVCQFPLKFAEPRSFRILDRTPDWRLIVADCPAAWGPPDYFCIDTRTGVRTKVLACADLNGAAISPDGVWHAVIGKSPPRHAGQFEWFVRWFRERHEPDSWAAEWSLILVHAESGRYEPPLSGIEHAKFSPDGKTLAVITSGGDLQLFEFPLTKPWAGIILPAAIAGGAVYFGLAALRRARRSRAVE